MCRIISTAYRTYSKNAKLQYTNVEQQAFDQIKAIKAQFGIEYHYIEQLGLK